MYARQKSRIFDIAHLYSKNQVAIKIYYLIIQIVHILRRLIEKGLKNVKDMNLKMKEISQNIKQMLILTKQSNLEVHRKVQLRFD